MTLKGHRPRWLTFDCYGTLIQWDEGLVQAVAKILAGKPGAAVDPEALVAIYDRYEHAMEQEEPYRTFRTLAAASLERTLHDLGVPPAAGDVDLLTASISAMPPHPDVVPVLKALKAAGFNLAIVSNTDDAIIEGNVRQLGGTVDRVITAEQARAYKPSRRIFEYAWASLGVGRDEIVHICASPVLDLTAARDLGFRAVWIDRGTGRQKPAGYEPDATLPILDGLPALLAQAGWI